jgi:carbon-monoxide dehydrogenase small subunit
MCPLRDQVDASHPSQEERMPTISVKIDGTTYRDDVEARLLFVHYLRDRLGLTGTNIGCDTSNCGACTVLVDGHSAKSCTMLAVQADGCEVQTIEGLARGWAGASEPEGGQQDGWHPLQTAFHTEHGLQCGYCTPGMIMASVDLLADNPDPSEDEIRHGLEGNLCRCTGYHNIVKAVQAAATQMKAGA